LNNPNRSKAIPLTRALPGLFNISFKMIYRFTFFLVVVLNSWVGLAQPGNLVENASFEFRPECDDNNGPLEEAPPWFNPTDATPDVFHECAVQSEEPCPYPETVIFEPWFFGVPTNTFGCQEPRSGLGYSGLYFYSPGISPAFDYREYLGIQLSEPLIAGETYLVHFYVSLAERTQYAVHALQVHFSPNQISEPTSEGYLNLTPQLSNTDGNFIHDKDNWVELSWEYIADGTESYMYIGNFESNLDIDIQYTLPDSIDPLFYYDASYYYVDDVYVGTDILSRDFPNNASLELWPNPAKDYLNLSGSTEYNSVRIYSIDGKLVYQSSKNWSEERQIDLNKMSSGIYLLEAISNTNNRILKKFVKR
jgi:hypothetical protein